MVKVEKKPSRKGIPSPCKEPVQCPHSHFRHAVPDRRGIARDKLFNILATPKGYWWEEPKKEKGDGEKPAKKSPVTHRRAHCGKHTRKYDRAYVHNFLAEVWSFLCPEMADRLKTMLMNEFSMSEKEANEFIFKQREANIVNSSTVSIYKKPRDIGDGKTVLDSVIKLRTPNKTYCDKFPKSNIGIRNSWIKDLSDQISEKMADYVLDTTTASRTERQQEIAQTLLNRFNTALEQKASLSKPKTQTHKTMVLVADRLSLWLDKNVKMSKDNTERLKDIEEAEEEKKKGGDWKKRLEEKKKLREQKRKPGKDKRQGDGPDGKQIVGADGQPTYGTYGQPIIGADGKPIVGVDGTGADGKPIVGADEHPREGATSEGESEGEESDWESEEEGGKGDQPRPLPTDSSEEEGEDGGLAQRGAQVGEDGQPNIEETGFEDGGKVQGEKVGEEDGKPGPKPEEGEGAQAGEGSTPSGLEAKLPEDAKPGGESSAELQTAGEGTQDGKDDVSSPAVGPQGASEDEGPKPGEDGAPGAQSQPEEGTPSGEDGGLPPSGQTKESLSKDDGGQGGDGTVPSETEGGTTDGVETITEEATEGKDESEKTDDGLPSETAPPSAASVAGEESEPGEDGLPSSETPQLTPGYTTDEEDTTKPSDELPSSETQPTEGEGSEEPGSKPGDSSPSVGGPGETSHPGIGAEDSLPEQMRQRELIKSIASIISETQIEGSSRQEAIKDVLGKQLEKEVGDESRSTIEEVASKVATWIDKMVEQVETEYGDRDRKSVDRVASVPHVGVGGLGIGSGFSIGGRLPPVSQKPKGSIFVVKKVDDRQGFDVDVISNNRAHERIRLARGRPLPRPEVPNPDAALEPSDVKNWVKWASAVSEMAQSWAEWIEDTVQEAQKRGEMLQTDDSPEKLKEWDAFRGKKSHGAQQWRKTKKEVDRSAELWNQKGKKTRELEKTADS